jgi:hypothetical protein
MEKDTDKTPLVALNVNSSRSFPKRRTAKRRGEAAEAAFLSKTISLGFEVAKPWGDSAPFDFIVNSGPKSWRVQVKSAYEKRHRRYTVKASGDKVAYTQNNIDFLVAYVVPENAWYVLPIAAVDGRAGLWFYPHQGSKSRFERYREAWCLMACQRDGECNPRITLRTDCQARAAGICPAVGGESEHLPRRPHPLVIPNPL